MNEAKTYMSIAIRAVLTAGEAILRIYTDPKQDFEIEMKEDHSPLTKADRAAHTAISEILKATPFPLLSEEGQSTPYSERKQWQTFWLVDPLDGTKEFIKRNGEFTVNIALISNGIPIMGVIFVPVSNTLYYGADSIGAFKAKVSNGQIESPQSMPLPEKHDDFVIVASRSHSNAETEDYINTLRAQHKNIRLLSAGSSLKICLIAEGRADVYPRLAPTMEWDTAAGHAIVRCTGSDIYQASTLQPLQYNKENLLNPSFIVQKKP